MLTPAMSIPPLQFVPFDSTAQPGAGKDSVERSTLPDRVLFGLDAEALAARMAEMGEPAWRGRQLAEAIYRQRIADLDAISTLSTKLRRRLTAEGWRVGRPAIVQLFQSADGTERYLICGQGREAQAGANSGDQTVETVWMPEGDDGETGDGSDPDPAETAGAQNEPGSVMQMAQGAEGSWPHRRWRGWSRATLCVSSQVGCAVNCQFCLTAKLGFQRNLTAGEIAGQVLAVFDRHAVEVGRDRVNLVFMGMGEPFLNYDNFMGAVRLLVREVGLSPRRMTVSTAGIVPGIERFAAEPPELRPKLAISLNAPNDRIRGEIMPINRKWPIEAVVEAVRKVRLRPRERITFEYVLLGGVTDRPENAAQVARLVRGTGLPAKVNLIAWNPGPGIPYSTPQPEAVEAFRCALANAGVSAYLRKPRGRDIYAACGQLKRTVDC
jgi:23S rRNA (adenine2503-C2)-methyltransferase